MWVLPWIISMIPCTQSFTLRMGYANDYIKDSGIIHKYKFLFDKMTYSNTIDDIANHKIASIYVNNNYNELVAVDNNVDSIMDYGDYHSVTVNPLLVNKIVDIATDNRVPIYFTDFDTVHIGNIISGLANALPILLIASVIISIIRNITMAPQNKMMQSGRGFNPFGTGFSGFGGMMGENQDIFVKPNVSISSWAGSPEVIEECYELIQYVENKEIYKQIGAEMPKGILLEGPPGTGKTLLAKAIARETNSTFISVSGAEFVEIFVGMGASRVRELFDNARENTPCIIFIDEIDAIGKKRGASNINGNDEREQTLNQLLYEMDGFNNNSDIIIMAATNRKDVLDPALLRPGRFDKIIRIPLPDKSSRIQILKYYLENKKTNVPIDIDAVAELTDGFSGAQLKNLVNEAAIISAKNNYSIIQENYIFDAFEKSVVGILRKNTNVSPDTQLRVAIHESGHSLLVLHFNDSFIFKKASIQSTYNGAGGYTLFSEKPEIREGGLYTKDVLKKRLIISMGGKAAETIFYGGDFVSLGAIQDLQQANQLAKRMVGNFGMGKNLEVFYNENVGEDSNPMFPYPYSDYTNSIMDKEVLDLVLDAFNEAKRILNEQKTQLIEFSILLENNKVVFPKDL
jgi:cell division protease FtsH